MSKLKTIATIVAILALVVLAAAGATKIQLDKFVDISVGVGGIIGAITAIFKKE